MDTAPTDDLVARGRAFATLKHEGSHDKADRPYIEHPERVAARVGAYDAQTQAAAWLHDVIEDEGVTAEELAAAGFPPEVVAAVVSLTKVLGEEHEVTVRRAAADPIGLVVKAADVADNTDPSRPPVPDEEKRAQLTAKYVHARAVLDELGAPRFG